MHSVIFVATPPGDARRWDIYLAAVATRVKAPAKGVWQLSENVWLLNLQESVAALGWLIALAEQNQVAYGILPLERAPEWLPAGFDPTSIADQNG